MTTTENKRYLFGTDGIRGKANEYPMVPELLMKIAMAAGQKFTRGDHRHTVVIGKDTRLSGYMVESALTSGFVAMGMDVITVGPLPTPAVAMLTRSMRADLGVMISASHNPYMDNGIKFFGPSGFKLTDREEVEIEQLIQSPLVHACPSNIGKAQRLGDAAGRYIEFAKSTLPRDLRLDGLKIVVDCAHGAAYRVAPTVLWELGAEVISIGIAPNGSNINDNCGATSLNTIREAVTVHQAHLGIALDGDADRLIMIDENGHIVDGDHLMALIATSWSAQGILTGNAVVATQMSNLGLERYLNHCGLNLIRTPVGDRYVIEAMIAHGCNIGGEQSGHLILSDYATTGDGLIAALQILRILVDQGKPLSELGKIYESVPQVMKSIRVSATTMLKNNIVLDAIRHSEEILSASKGRLLIRPSGTEPLIRIMGEADDVSLLHQVVGDIADLIATTDTPSTSAVA